MLETAGKTGVPDLIEVLEPGDFDEEQFDALWAAERPAAAVLLAVAAVLRGRRDLVLPLGEHLLAEGEAELAVRLCRAFLPLQEDRHRAYRLLGFALLDSGEAEEEVKVLTRTLHREPHVASLAEPGLRLGARGEWDRALHWLGRAVEQDPHYQPAVFGLGSVLYQQEMLGPAREVARFFGEVRLARMLGEGIEVVLGVPGGSQDL